MRKSLCLAIALSFALTAAAQTVEPGKKIRVSPTGVAGLPAPVYVPEGGQPDKPIKLVSEDGGIDVPVTNTERGSVFILPEGLATETVLTIQWADETETPRVNIVPKEGSDELDVLINDELFTTYHYSKENKKPFLWPMLAEGGVHVTRDYPMGEAEHHADHPHHKSYWSAHGEVNGADCWGEGENSGFQVVEEVTWDSGDAVGWIRSQNVWQDKDHNPVLNETREYRFFATPSGARLFDTIVTFTAAHGDVLFGDTKEGGIAALRIRDAINEEHGGTITLATGEIGESEAWGKPSPWCDYSGALLGYGVRGMTIFDHPGNLRHPTNWHVRAYGLMGANPFGYSYFYKGQDKNGDFTLKNGESQTFRYRTLVHSGDVEEANVAGHWKNFVSNPSVGWANTPN